MIELKPRSLNFTLEIKKMNNRTETNEIIESDKMNETTNTNLSLYSLPKELLQHVLSFNDDQDIIAIARTSKLGLFNANNPLLWKERVLHTFQLDQEKLMAIQHKDESFKEMYIRLKNHLKNTSYIVFRATMNKTYDPLTYFNNHLQNVLNVNTFQTLAEMEDYLNDVTIRGARYVAEVALSLPQLNTKIEDESATLKDLGQYIRRIFPDQTTSMMNYLMPDQTKAQSITVTYQDDKFIPKNDMPQLNMTQLRL